MDKIKQLLRKLDEARKAMRKIVDTAVEEERGYEEEEREKVKELRERIAGLEEQIRDLEAMEAERGNIPACQEEPEARGIETPEASDIRARFRNLGEMVRDIWNAQRHGRFSDNFRRHSEWQGEQFRAMNISDGTSLGFMIPDTFEAGTLQLRGAGGWIRQRARVIPPGEYPDAKFKKRVVKQGTGGAYNGILWNFTGEGNAPVDESKIEFYLFTLDPSDNKIAAFYITSEESLQNPTAVTADMEMTLRDGLAELEDELFILGDGIAKPLGILNSTGIKKVGRNTSAKFLFDDVLQMAKNHYPRAVNKNWEISLDLYEQVGAMKDGAGRLIMIAGDATKGIPDLLHGRPIHWSEVNPTAGETGDVILADWSYYYIKDGSGPYFATDPYTRFLEGEIRVKMTVKMDGDTWVREPLTLKNGMTVSPFVVLE